jgi:hypothetical protein
MTKLTARTVGGWSLMEPLAKKEPDPLKRNLVLHERMPDQVIGSSGHADVATDAQDVDK